IDARCRELLETGRAEAEAGQKVGVGIEVHADDFMVVAMAQAEIFDGLEEDAIEDAAAGNVSDDLENDIPHRVVCGADRVSDAVPPWVLDADIRVACAEAR